MAYKKITLRRLPKETRKLATLINDLESTTRKLKNYLATVESLELDSRALTRAVVSTSPLPDPSPCKTCERDPVNCGCDFEGFDCVGYIQHEYDAPHE